MTDWGMQKRFREACDIYNEGQEGWEAEKLGEEYFQQQREKEQRQRGKEHECSGNENVCIA